MTLYVFNRALPVRQDTALALNFSLEGKHQFPPVRGTSLEMMVTCIWNFAKGTTAIDVGAMGYFEAAYGKLYFLCKNFDINSRVLNKF